ncbi:MAG: EAL domain-containing protein [Chromatiales bacterium]|nr:EAL domain-containing protein [Chromatiales bacterium]
MRFRRMVEEGGAYMDMASELAVGDLLEIVRNHRYGVEYQPIVALHSGDTVGYEALARFYSEEGRSIPPDAVFKLIHDSPLMLFQVEFEIKQLQIRMAPKDELLFLNVDPDAFVAFGVESSENPLVQLIMQREASAVVEIIENTDVTHSRYSESMAEAFSQAGIRLALDDLGAADSVVAFPVLIQVDFLKLDRHWLRRCDDRNWYIMAQSLITFAHETGKQVVVEGVETEADLETASHLGADFVQGFLFKERFISRRHQDRRRPSTLDRQCTQSH